MNSIEPMGFKQHSRCQEIDLTTDTTGNFHVRIFKYQSNTISSTGGVGNRVDTAHFSRHDVVFKKKHIDPDGRSHT